MKLYAKAILWCLSLVVFETELHGCVNPSSNGVGVESDYVFRYTFVGVGWTTERQVAVIDAMNYWTSLGLAVFTPVSEGQEANVNFEITALNPGVVGHNDVESVDGWVRRMDIKFTSNTNYLETGYYKAALHELGHGFGLADSHGSGGTSIMNQFLNKDDTGGNLPGYVTYCDYLVAELNTHPDADNDGYNKGGSDCDDNDPTNHPNADNDGDGYYDDRCGGNDCDDMNPYAFPGSQAWMFCLYADLNCNGAMDILDCTGYGSPILISTDGGRITLTSRADGVMFDLLGIGEKIQIPWTVANSDDAWLVMDRNDNGAIDDGTELFGTVTPQPPPQSGELPNGFAALGVYDQAEIGGNGDGLIDSNDAIFSRLQLWLDRNHNGISEADELYSLSEFGVIKIDLNYKDAFKVDDYGNIGRYRSKVYDAHGFHVGRWAWDVLLKLQ